MTDAPFCAAPVWNKDRLLALSFWKAMEVQGYFVCLFNVICTKHKPLGFSLCLSIYTNIWNEKLLSPFPSYSAVMTCLPHPRQVWAVKQPRCKKKNPGEEQIIEVLQAQQAGRQAGNLTHKHQGKACGISCISLLWFLFCHYGRQLCVKTRQNRVRLASSIQENPC